MANIDEDKTGLPSDVYPETIVVKKGDTVSIHFFNTEDKAGNLHSFTILDKPYDNIDKVVKGGESPDISFAATKTGIFTYECKFHLPTMRGQLAVKGSDKENRIFRQTVQQAIC